jgi:hypothetical protein
MTPADWKRRIEAIEAAISRAIPMPLNIRIVNDPEEGLDEFRVGEIDPSKTIEIGDMQHRDLLPKV